MNYDISVIVPVYNGEKYIEKCFESIKNQTIKNIEVIFVNDGSTDNSKQILDNIKKVNKGVNVKIIHQENKGPGSARNTGIINASGKYIGFVDIDDKPKINMYEKLYSLVEKYNVDIAVCGFEVVDSKNNIKEIILPKYKQEAYLNKNDIKDNVLKRIICNGGETLASQCNKIYRKSIIDKYLIRVDERRSFGEDYMFNLLLLGKIEKIGFIEEPLYKYIRCNNESLASRYLDNAFDLFTESMEFRIQRMKEWGIYTDEYIRIANDKFCDFIYDRVIKNELYNKRSTKQKANRIKYYVNNEILQDAADNCLNSRYGKLYKNRKYRTLYIRAYFDINIRPILGKVKRILRR